MPAPALPPPAVPAAVRTGLYLYAIAPAAADGLRLGPVGLEGAEVATVAGHGLAAVVSPAEVKTYELNRANLLAHQRVLEALVPRYPHLPVKFCTVAADPAQILDKLLAPRAAELHARLAELGHLREYSVKALVADPAKVYEELLAEEPALRARKDKLAKLNPTRARDQLIQLGQDVKAALAGHLDARAARVFDRLRPLAAQAKQGVRAGDRMAANAAFLLDPAALPAFEAAVEELGRELGAHLTLRLFGPASPSNFVEIRVQW